MSIGGVTIGENAVVAGVKNFMLNFTKNMIYLIYKQNRWS